MGSVPRSRTSFQVQTRKREATAMEVKGSNLRRMFRPTYNKLESSGVLGQGLTEAILKVELTYPCII